MHSFMLLKKIDMNERRVMCDYSVNFPQAHGLQFLLYPLHTLLGSECGCASFNF